METTVDKGKKSADLEQLSREELLVKCQQLQNQVDWMTEQIKLSAQKQYGSSSEKTTDPNQLSLFNEAEATADEKVPEVEAQDISRSRKKTRGKREKDLAALPLDIIEYELPVSEQACPQCGEPLHRMTREVRTELVYIPPQFKKVEHTRMVYACRNCEKNDITTPIIKADAPQPLIKGSIASAQLVAGIINGKYVNALPLYRQEKEFERCGVYLPRQNMANWVIRCADDYLYPLYERMRTELISKEVIHVDETTTQVLKEPGRKPTSKSYMWLYRTSGCDQPIVLFEYQQTRESKHPAHFLRNFKGYIHSDGYAGYHNLPPAITVVGCLAHARRKFDEAFKIMQPQDRTGSRAEVGLAYCNALFALERKLEGMSFQKRYETRLEKSQPVLEQFHAWLEETVTLVAPKSKIGRAISYALDQWQYLTNYLLDGRLELSNNRAERCIRPFTIGRKNSLFSDTPKGAQASAIIYSLIETAKENGLKPYDYLLYLFKSMPNSDWQSQPALLDQFLPWSKLLPAACYSPATQDTDDRVDDDNL